MTYHLGVSDESLIEPDHRRGDDDHRAIARGPLLVEDRQSPPLCESIDAALDHIAPPIGVVIEGRFAAGAAGAPTSLVVPLRDHVRNAAPPERLPAAVAAVAC